MNSMWKKICGIALSVCMMLSAVGIPSHRVMAADDSFVEVKAVDSS